MRIDVRCVVCDKEFFSLEWYKAETEGLVMCDECVLYVYQARKDIKQHEIESIGRKIKDLECKIKSS